MKRRFGVGIIPRSFHVIYLSVSVLVRILIDDMCMCMMCFEFNERLFASVSHRHRRML